METPTSIVGWVAAIVLGLLHALQMWRNRGMSGGGGVFSSPEIDSAAPEEQLEPPQEVKEAEDKIEKGESLSAEAQSRMLLKILEKTHFLEEARQQDSQVIRDIQDRSRAHAETLRYIRKKVEKVEKEEKGDPGGDGSPPGLRMFRRGSD